MYNKTILRLTVAAVAALAVSNFAEAGQARNAKRHMSQSAYGENTRYYSRAGQTTDPKEETLTDILADNRDRAGNYKGYPNWARLAFSGTRG